MGLEPAADGEDGSLQFGWNPLGTRVVGPRQVLEALGAGLQVAAPPLVEPELGAADGGTDGLDGSAGEAQGNGAMTSCEFVVHGYLRVAVARGGSLTPEKRLDKHLRSPGYRRAVSQR